ncbi:MAG TPA: RpiB/LacA/LacB family sugar-phosphate isomerase [Candidatus Woesebacteria bacterium]|nr:RpiB/LacA/LacB family sugar-phosphate isomerase [Candidatus Woesebacteria bacterium]
MKIYIGADHNGFGLKHNLSDYLKRAGYDVVDVGDDHLDPNDDFPVYANKVAEAVFQNPENYLGIVICGSGAGVCIAANRYKGIYCTIALNVEQVKSARSHDHINVLSLAADHTTEDQANELVDTFINTELNTQRKYKKRLEMVDEEKKY